MTERERWIVYPLLFLALGAALRDKLSDQTRTKRIECQELVVVGEVSPGRPPVPLVQIGAVPRESADAPHIGQILVNGLVQAQGVRANGIQTDYIQATKINAGGYFFQSVPFAPRLVPVVPGTSASDWLRAQQQQQQSAGAHKDDDDTDEKDAADVEDKPAQAPPNVPPVATPPKSSTEASPPAK